MSNKLYVGNMSYQLEENVLEDAFNEFGKVLSVKIITDHATGKSKGFGFIEMETSEQAQNCVESMDGKELSGRPIRVSIARERERNDRGGGGGRGGRGGGGGRNRW